MIDGLQAVMMQPAVYRAGIILNFIAMIMLPTVWIGSLLVMMAWSAVFFLARHDLPFRTPQLKALPGKKGRDGKGIIYLGNRDPSGEELWITNDDARRHALVLGTTGSGKALPIDTLVLTESGWKRIGDLVPGSRISHPYGGQAMVRDIYPQGKLPRVRLNLADGRSVTCSRDHLWRVNIASNDSDTPLMKVMRTADIGFHIEARCIGAGVEPLPSGLFIPLAAPSPGRKGELNVMEAGDRGRFGLKPGDSHVPLVGSVAARVQWLLEVLSSRHAQRLVVCRSGYLEVPAIDHVDAAIMRRLVWSLGGCAMQIERCGGIVVVLAFPGQEAFELCGEGFDVRLARFGNEIVSVEGRLCPDDPSEMVDDDGVEMVCISVDAEDGLFLIDDYVVTHNTELLLGMVSQSLIWSSGFLFIDGKGTGEFHARVWSLAKRFGRQDDYRILNFTGDSKLEDLPPVGSDVQSNTLNPFAHGTPDQLMNLIVSLMSDTGSGTNLWQHRAMALVTSAIKALCEMRDTGDVLLNVESIREYLPLGVGFRKDLLEGKIINDIDEVPRPAWEEVRTRGGMIELYLRALNGEFSRKSHAALKGFFDSLPGFNLVDALNGNPQQGKAAEQHGFLSMQLTRPLGSLADDFGHIFSTPYGEVDIEDIVLNRRILVVLLPALQKAPEEMRNCGRIVVALLKMMMGKVAGSELVGSKRTVVDAKSTMSSSPFIIVLDEAGYYMVRGIDVMMAQARSLGFMMVIAGQDMAAMQQVSPQIAETVAANARLTIAGATEDAHRTWQFLQRKFSTVRVPVVTGQQMVSGLLGQTLMDRPDTSFVEKDRIRIDELQKLGAGEFYVLMESRLVRANAYYTGEYWTPDISVNKLLAIRGPYDRAPGLDTDREMEFFDALEELTCRFLDEAELTKTFSQDPFDPHDMLRVAVEKANEMTDSDQVRLAGIHPLQAGIAAVLYADNRFGGFPQEAPEEPLDPCASDQS